MGYSYIKLDSTQCGINFAILSCFNLFSKAWGG